MERNTAHRSYPSTLDRCAQVVVFAVCLVVALTCPGAVAQSVSDSGGSSTSHQDRNHDQVIAWSVIITVVTVLLIVITAAIVYTVRRARYGALCCIRAPRISYRLEAHESDAESGEDSTDLHPPAYKPSSLSPPEYCDALHDVVLQQGRRQPQTIFARSLVYTTTLSAPPPYHDNPGEESPQAGSEADGRNRFSDEEGRAGMGQDVGDSEPTHNPDMPSDPPSTSVSVPVTHQQSQAVQLVHEGNRHKALQGLEEHLQVYVWPQESDGEEEGKDGSSDYCSCEDSTPLVN